jgi:hypothetical protein
MPKGSASPVVSASSPNANPRRVPATAPEAAVRRAHRADRVAVVVGDHAGVVAARHALAAEVVVADRRRALDLEQVADEDLGAGPDPRALGVVGVGGDAVVDQAVLAS